VPQKRTGRPGQRLRLDRVRESFTRSPQKSTRRASRELQQDGAPPHFHLEVRSHLSTTLPQRWIGRTSNEDSTLIPWPPRSPDLTPGGVFLWGYVKDKVYVPPLPRDLPELRQRIVAAVDTIDVDMLQRVWQELDYRTDVCQVTRGGHMECL
jgi:hypothetical protein